MNSPKIFRSTVPGDERTKPIPTVFTEEERLLNARRVQLQIIIDNGRAAEQELRALRLKCKHHAFIDEEGFPQDVRSCAVCGVSMGFV